MARYNEQMVAALTAHVSGNTYPALTNLVQKLGLNLFSVISPLTMQRMEVESASNPNIIGEAISLMELCDALSLFYQEDTEQIFSETVIDMIASTRTRIHRAQVASLNASAMNDYFTDEKFHAFLLANPVFVGLYIFIFLTTVVSA